VVTKNKIIEELNFLTEKLSSLTWTINLGVLGTTWSLLIASGTVPQTVRLQTGEAIPILSLCLLALLFEMFQYLSGYATNRQALTRMEREGLDKFSYDTSALLYRVREWCFCAKIGLTIAAAIWLLALVLRKLI
jgi:hypothetical protein